MSSLPPHKLVDLSHEIEHGMVTYRGLPAPVISDHLTREASRALYASGTEFHIGRIEMVANTGTYVDAPSHRWADGADLAGLPLGSLAALPGRVVRVPERERRIGPERVPEGDLAGSAVLFHTGWSRHWWTEAYFEGSPFLAAETAHRLRDAGVRLVGVDAYNVDDTGDKARPVHSALLRAGIPVLEHLTGLEALPDSGFLLFAVPPKVRGMGTFPVRAFAMVGT